MNRGLTRAFRSDDLRDAFVRSQRNGWGARRDGRGHVVLEAPDGHARIRLSASAYSSGATRAKVEEMKWKGAIGRDRRTERMDRRRQRGLTA